MPDPDLQQMSQNRKRVSLKPYSKLAAAPWVAGNIAYLKDFDYLECRLKSTAGKASDKGDDQGRDDGHKKGGGKKKKGENQATSGNKDTAGKGTAQ